MSDPTQPAVAMAGGAPAIYDLGYKRYDGLRTPHNRRWLTVLRIAMRLSLKWWLWVTLVFAVAQVAIFGVVMYFLHRASAVPDAGAAIEGFKPDFLVLKLLTEWYGVIPLCFVVGLFAGGSAVADDARSGAFQFYFARPVSKGAYLAGKLVAVCTLTAAMSLGPALILCLARVAMSAPGEWAAASLLLGRGLLVALIVALVLGIPVVALSSLSASRGVVQGGWAAVFMLSWIIGRIVASVTASPWPALISIPANLQVIGGAIFGQKAAGALPVWASALVLVALVAGSAALLRWRLRNVEAITVS